MIHTSVLPSFIACYIVFVLIFLFDLARKSASSAFIASLSLESIIHSLALLHLDLKLTKIQEDFLNIEN